MEPAKARCDQGVDHLDIEDPADRITEITASYTAMVEHASSCQNCNEAGDEEDGDSDGPRSNRIGRGPI